MTVSISLSPTAEQRLADRAKAEGVDLSTFVSNMVEAAAKQLTPAREEPHPDQATLDLLDQWEKEDQTDDPAEIARREKELLEFMKGMNESRRFSDGPNARIPYPECE
jgi:hypothetical protein